MCAFFFVVVVVSAKKKNNFKNQCGYEESKRTNRDKLK